MSFGEDVAVLVAEANDPLLATADRWERVRLGSVADVLNGFPWKSDRFGTAEGVPLIRIRDVTTGATETRYDGPITEGYWVEDGDLLVGMDGDFNVRRWKAERGLLNQRVCKITTKSEHYSTSLLEYVLPGYLQLINRMTSSVTVKHLSSRTLAELPLPLPPAAEQRRIVAKLDALTARLARARAELDRLSVLTATLRREVLSQAFAGDLTAEWRAEQHGMSEDRSQPPVGWSNATLAELVGATGLVSDGDWVESKDQDPEGVVRLTQLADIGEGVFRDRSRRFMSTDAAKRLRCTYLEQDDVLIARMPDPMGRACLFPGLPQPAVTAVDVFIWRGDGSRANPRWVVHAVNSPVIREQIEGQAGGTTRQRIAGGKLKVLELPVPPLDEQCEIVRRISAAFARADRLEAEAARARALIDRLEAAILARAFCGKLVPQDPSDEPASVLLDRIRAQRAAAPRLKRGRHAAAVV